MTRLPPTSSLPQAIRRVRPTIYTVSVYILAAVLLLEVVMVISVFWLRAMVVPVNFEPPKARASAAAPVQPAVQSIAPADVPNLAVSGRRTLLALPAANDRQTQIASLLEHARTLRSEAHGDPQHSTDLLKGALATLTQAEDLDPRNPGVLQEMAEVYYLLDDAPHSKIYWQRLIDLGPAVGQSYALACDHMRLLSSSPAADILQSPTILPRTIYIHSVEKTPVTTDDNGAHFNLKTVLMRRDPAMPDFDQKKLQPYVIFYQRMPNGALVPDLRPHKGGFQDQLLFWNNKQTQEPFTVEYSLPIAGTPGPDGKPMGDYYGFVIGIYYDKTLQDVRSEPADLITRLPLPDGIE